MGDLLGEQMSKKLGRVVVLAGLCALSLLLLNCGSSSSRPSGMLYVLTQGSNGYGNNVSSFTIDYNTGNLSLVNSDASTCPTAASVTNPEPCGLPLDILLDPTGATAFVLNQGVPSATNPPVPPTIYPYTVNSDGSLSTQQGAAVYWTCISPTGAPCTTNNSYPDTAVVMTRDAAGQFLFVIDDGANPSPTTCPLQGTGVTNSTQATNFVGCPSISVFAMKPGSTTLKFVSQSLTYQSPFFLSKLPTALSAITFTPSSPANAPAQELLFVTNNYDLCTVACGPTSTPTESPNDNTVSVYSVSSSGVLTETSDSPYVVAATSPSAVFAVNTNPAGQPAAGGVFVYVGDNDPNGSHLYPFQVCTEVNAVCKSQDVTNNNQPVYLMTPLVQTCTQPPCNTVPPSSAGQNVVGMLVDPTNNFLYVASEDSSQVFGFQINAGAGTLKPLSTSAANLPTGAQPVAMAMHPSVNNSGQFLFTSNSGADSVSVFTLSTTTGAMSSPFGPVSTPAPPSGMTAH